MTFAYEVYLRKKSYCRMQKHTMLIDALVNTKLCFDFPLRDGKLEGTREGSCGSLWGGSRYQMQAVTCWLLPNGPELYDGEGHWESRGNLSRILDAPFNRLR